MNDLFISYKVNNRSLAIQYFKIFRDRGYGVWFDQKIPKDSDWKHTIEEEIKKSKLVIALFSKYSLKNDTYIHNQIATAQKFSIPIVAIIVDGTDKKKIQKEFHLSKYTLWYHKGEKPWNCIEKIHTYISKKIRFYDEIENLYIQRVEECKKRTKYLNHPFFCLAITFILACFMFRFGVHFLNLNLSVDSGWIALFMMVLLVISYPFNRLSFWLQTIFSILFLVLVQLFFSPFYLYNISIIPSVFLFLYAILLGLRYTFMTRYIWTIIYAFLFGGLFGCLGFVVAIFFKQILLLNFEFPVTILMVLSLNLIFYFRLSKNIYKENIKL